MHNILYIANSGQLLGGGEVSLLHLVKGLDRSRFKPIVLCPEYGNLVEAFSALGINPIIRKLPSFKALRLIQILRTIIELIHIIKFQQIDCIHSNGSRAAIYSGFAGRIAGAPLIAHFRVSTSDGLVDKIIAALASRVVVVSRAAGERFQWLSDCKKELIYNGVDTDLFRPKNDAGFRCNRFNVSDTDVLIGAVGRISPEKGLDVLLKAIVLLREKKHQISLIIFGEGDGGYTAVIRRMINDYRLDNVQLAGFVYEIEKIYPNLDILCLSSFTEGFNRSIIEAMSCGVPVVATKVGGNPEAVIDNQTGLLVASGDAEELAKALGKLADDKQLRTQMGNSGRLRVEQNFSIKKNIHEIQDVYGQLLSHGDPSTSGDVRQ